MTVCLVCPRDNDVIVMAMLMTLNCVIVAVAAAFVDELDASFGTIAYCQPLSVWYSCGM